MTEKDDIEKLFSSVFEGAEMPPPDGLKESIDAALFGGAAQGKRKIGWMWWSIVLLLIVAGGTYGLWSSGAVAEENAGESAHHAQENSAVSSSTNSGDRGAITAQNGSSSLEQSGEKYQEKTEGVDPIDQQRNSLSGNQSFTGNDGKPSNSNKKLEGPNPESGGGVTQTGNDKIAKPKGNDLGVASAGNGNPKDPKQDLEGAKNRSGATDPAQDVIHAKLTVNPAENLVGTTEAEWIPSPEIASETSPKHGAWSLAGYVGASFGHNNLKGQENMWIEEVPGMYASLEALYPLSRRFGLSFGVDFSQRKDRLLMSTAVLDSSIVGNTYVYVYDSNQVIIDSTATPIYATTSSNLENVGYVRYFSIAVPVYFHYSIGIANQLTLDAAFGARFSYQKFRNEELAPNIVYPDAYKTFGLNLSFRPELLYTVNRMSVGIYGRFEYDVLNGMQWNAFTRTRWSTGLGLSLRYKL